MKEEKGKNIIIVLLLVIVVALVAFVLLILTNTISIKLGDKFNNSLQISDNVNVVDNSSNETESDSTTNKIAKYSQETFKKIVDDELYILFGLKSLSEVTNGRKLGLVFDKIEKKYSYGDNDVYSTVQSISRKKVEEVFNNTSISELGIEHQSYDVYVVNDYSYNRNNDQMSKRGYAHCGIYGKVSNYEKKDSKYILSVKYMFPDTCEGLEKFYGSYGYTSQNDSNFIVKAHDDNMNYIDPQKYIDENYDSIKDKLDTYVYTFEVNNGKIKLVDYSIN